MQLRSYDVHRVVNLPNPSLTREFAQLEDGCVEKYCKDLVPHSLRCSCDEVQDESSKYEIRVDGRNREFVVENRKVVVENREIVVEL